jgi:hypothetical protein
MYIVPQGEPAMLTTSYRYLYQPKPDRTPAWLRRIWLWF